MCSFWGVFAIVFWCGTGAPLVKGRGASAALASVEVAPAFIVFHRARGYILDLLNRIHLRITFSSLISQKAKYALRALVALAKEGDSLMISEIAARKNIPRKFLEQILLEMKRHGIVHSRRGKLGGYSLLMPPDKITYGQVLRIIDGPIAPLPCLSRIAYRRCADCRTEETCEIRRVFARVAESAREVLDRTTIADSLSASLLLDEPEGGEQEMAHL
jgi:Rrf2 family protein